MLTWDEEVKPSFNKDTQLGLQQSNPSGFSGNPLGGVTVSFSCDFIRSSIGKRTSCNQCSGRTSCTSAENFDTASPRECGRQANHQRPDRCESAGAVQVQMGLGKISRDLRKPLDAAGSEHDA